MSDDLSVRIVVLSSDLDWQHRIIAQLTNIGFTDAVAASPLEDIPPAGIAIIDASGVIPTVIGRTIYAISADASPPINVAWVRLPVADDVLAHRIHEELERLSALGTSLDPEFRIAALETLFNVSPECVEFVDNKIQLLDVNHAFTIATGHSLPVAVGKTTAELFRGDDHNSEIYKEIDDALSHGNVWRGQLMGLNQDGTVSYLDSILSPVRVRGEIAGYIGIKQPLDHDQLVTRAFATSDPTSETAFDAAMDTFFLHDFSGRVFNCNLAGSNLLQQVPGAQPRRLLTLFDETTTTRLVRHWGTLDRTHAEEVECPLRLTSGEGPTVFGLRSRLVSVGGVRLVVSIGRDISPRVTLSRALRARTDELQVTKAALAEARAAAERAEKRIAQLESQTRSNKEIAARQVWFRAIFEGARDSMIIASTAGIVADVNKATLEVTGRDKVGLVGSKVTDLFTEDCQDEIDGAITMLDTGESQNTLLDLKMHGGRGKVNSVTVNLTRVMIDKDPHLHIVARDVTILKKAEREREQLEKRLRQSQQLESLGTLAGGIAHDFNNLLGPIVAYSELLEPFTAMDLDAEEMRRDIVTAANRATELVTRILHFSRRSERRSRVLYVAEVLSEVARLLQRTLPPGLSLVFGEVDVDARIECDPTELQQVIMNLCTNAIHAMERDGGVLSLSLGRVNVSAAAELEQLRDLEDGDFIRIEVADSGHGMSPEVRDRVFEPYFTTKTVTRGTGLGLATVFGIVRDLGGTIHVQSELSVGTQFDIYIPASSKVPEALTETGTPMDIGELGIKNILVVDDEPANLRMLDRVLSTFGVKTTGFSAPEDALLYMREFSRNYDVLITDLTMPKMTGIELTQELRTFDRHIPIIVYTGYGDERNEAQAISAGARMMIRKPVTRRVLLQSLSVLVNEGFVAAARRGHMQAAKESTPQDK